MADNYLEKKMELHKARTVRQAVSKRNNLYSLMEHSSACGVFDGFVVREDQLVRTVGAAARVAPCVPFRFKFALADEAVALRSCDSDIVKATAYIAICPCEPSSVDYLLLGRVVQAMLLQAAEMGLCAAFVQSELLPVVGNVLSLPVAPSVVLALGRSAEPPLPLETVVADTDIKKLIL